MSEYSEEMILQLRQTYTTLLSEKIRIQKIIDDAERTISNTENLLSEAERKWFGMLNQTRFKPLLTPFESQLQSLVTRNNLMNDNLKIDNLNIDEIDMTKFTDIKQNINKLSVIVVIRNSEKKTTDYGLEILRKNGIKIDKSYDNHYGLKSNDIFKYLECQFKDNIYDGPGIYLVTMGIGHPIEDFNSDFNEDILTRILHEQYGSKYASFEGIFAFAMMDQELIKASSSYYSSNILVNPCLTGLTIKIGEHYYRPIINWENERLRFDLENDYICGARQIVYKNPQKLCSISD